MKTKTSNQFNLTRRHLACAIMLAVSATLLPAHADQTMSNVISGNLTTGASWVSGTAPGTNDIAIWNTNSDAGTLANPLLLGANLAWKGIKEDSSSGSLPPIFIGGTNENAGGPYTLALGVGGISLVDTTAGTAVANNLNVNANLMLQTNQTWGRTRVGTGSETINIYGATKGTNLTVNITGYSTLNFYGDCSGVSAIGLSGGAMYYYSNFPATSINVASGAALGFSQAGGNYTEPGKITGAGRIEKRNASTLSLTATNTYSGGTRLYGGTLSFSNGSLSPMTLSTELIEFYGNTTLAWIAGNNQDLSSYLKIDDGKVATFDTGANDVTLGNAFLLGTAANATVTKIGSGALTLAGYNTFTNVTTVSQGRLNLTGNSASPTTVNTGTALGGQGTLSSALTLSNGCTLYINPATYAALTVGDLTLDGTDTIAFDTLPTSSGPVPVLNYNGALTGGLGNLSLPNAANYRTANFALTAGTPNIITLDLGNASRTWSGTAATWDVGTTAAWAEGDQKFYWGDAVTFNDSGLGSSTVTLSGVLQPQSVTVSTSGSYLFQGSGSLAGGATLALNSGTLTLGTADSFSGGTTLSSGTLNLNNASALGTGSLTINYGCVLNNTSDGAISNAQVNAQIWYGDFSFAGANDLDLGTGPVALNGYPLNLTVNSKTLTIGGIISGAGAGITKLGTGVLALTGANTYSGNTTTVANGTLVIGGSNGALSAQPMVLGDANSNTSGKLMVGDANNVKNLTVSSLTTAGAGTTNAVVGGNVSVSTLTIASGMGATYSGILGGAGVNENNLGLTLSGAGSQYLSGVNTYTGTTFVSAGTLFLTEPGSIGNSALIRIAGNATLDVTGRADQTLTLQNGQTLTGGGTVNGNVTSLTGSTINPGGLDYIGTTTITGNATLGGNLLMEISGPSSSDQLSATGTITYGGDLTVTNIGSTLQVGDTFQLFPAAVTSFANINLPATDATGNHYTWTNNVAVDGSISVASVGSAVNANPTNLIASVSGGVLNLSWPADHTGWRLLVQTNNLAAGISSNTNDWTTVTGSATTNQATITIDAAKPAEFYRLVYP